jgi:hypothetical protein
VSKEEFSATPEVPDEAGKRRGAGPDSARAMHHRAVPWARPRVRRSFTGNPITSMRPLLTALFLACAPACSQAPEVVIVGTDYAFAHPDTLPAGPTALAFENRGRVDHELMLAKLKAGVTLEQALAANQRGADVSSFLEDGASVLLASPGGRSTARLLVDLEAGRTYAVVCLMRDDEQAPPHAAMGMVGSIVVN